MLAEKVKTHSFGAEVSKVLKLVIHSLYTNRDIFLRELVSNASDACDKLRYQAITQPDLLSEDTELKITLSTDEKARTLTISDNGIGMNEAELIGNLGTIAKSGTQEFLSQLTGDKQKDMPLIGQFGVGFYSAFMVADRVDVVSRKAGEEQGNIWSSQGEGEFTVTPLEGKVARGTSITLHLKEGEDAYLERFRLQHIVSTYSDHISLPIYYKDEDGTLDKLNEGAALWTRPKNDISEEQYKEFYHHVAHSPDEPWMTLHNKAEGKIEYTNLLFVPSLRPFDLFHPDRKRRVKLYVKRVFITDEGLEIVPHFLRFLRGVIDSEDLPLNISRETLQHNPLLDKIRDSIVKRVLGELKKRAEKDPESYTKFWENFGGVLKEGLCEAIAPKEQILEVSRFLSTHSPDKLTSIDDYISRMKEGQEHIFFITGDRAESLLKSPKLEGFTKRGIEVLLFTDHVDDFWVNVVHKYKEKSFKSVTRADIDLDKISPLTTEEDKPAPQTEAAKDKVEKLVAELKALFGEEISDVRLSGKLLSTPVCLSVNEGAMDIRMERFLMEHKQLAGRAAKILEINPTHPIILSLADRLNAKGMSDEVKDTALLLLDQAKIVEGEEVSDPGAFSRRLSYFLERSLAA